MFDLAIYGSTSGAVAAAIQSARNGRRVALISPQAHIGGNQVEGLGATDIDNQLSFTNSTAVSGLALEFHERISIKYGRLHALRKVLAEGRKDPSVWFFESKVAEQVIMEWLREYPNIRILYDVLVEVEKHGTRIVALKLRSTTVSAKLFMECTYEGDLLEKAGVSTIIGRESSDQYGESLAGVRNETPYTQILLPVDPHVTPGDAKSGLIEGISAEPFGKAGQADKHLAAYSYRIPLTDVEANRIPITRPSDYDPAQYELHRRYAKLGGQFFLPRARLPNRKTDLIGSEAPLATDLLGMNDDWPAGSDATRANILQATASFTRGLLYFFTSDSSLPVDFRTEWQRWGYCKDEFVDNDHFPRMLYIRDARRMRSDYVITQHHASVESNEPPANDPIAIAYWPTDTHCARRILRDGHIHNEGFIFKDGHKWKPFGMSYRAFVPKASEVTNLFSPVCPSASHVGYGAVRLEHQFHMIAQACSLAADICLDDNLTVQAVPYPRLAESIAKHGIKTDASLVGMPDSYPGGTSAGRIESARQTLSSSRHSQSIDLRNVPHQSTVLSKTDILIEA